MNARTNHLRRNQYDSNYGSRFGIVQSYMSRVSEETQQSLLLNHFSSLICKCALNGVGGGLCKQEKNEKPLAYMGMMMMMQYTTKQGGHCGIPTQTRHPGTKCARAASERARRTLHTFSTELNCGHGYTSASRSAQIGFAGVTSARDAVSIIAKRFVSNT